MNQLQNDYKLFRESILQILWQQWASLGVAGHLEKKVNAIIDPEALLLCSLSLCRYDPRLFDEIIDWLAINGEYINVQRLSALRQKYSFKLDLQIASVAKYLSQNKEYTLKWRKLSDTNSSQNPEPLFYTLQGKPIPVSKDPDELFLKKGLLRNKIHLRKYSSPFPIESQTSLLLRLRAFIGISARAELLCIMASGAEIHPAEAARLTGYNRKTLQNALNDMARSGIVQWREGEREKYYRLNSGILNGLLSTNVIWIHWAPLYKALEIIWFACDEDEKDTLLLSSLLRSYAKEAQKFFDESKTGIHLTDPSRTLGADYVAIFQKDLLRIAQECYRII